MQHLKRIARLTLPVALSGAVLLAACTPAPVSEAAEPAPAAAAPVTEPAAPGLPLAITATDEALAWGGCPPIFPESCGIAVLHGDPAAPNADVFLRVPGGLGLAAHTHTSAERMVLVAGELQVKYLGSPAVTLVPGQYAYGPAALPHQATCTSDETCVLFIAFEGPVDALEYSGSLD
ncbi:MAG: cupin domain-containing protein [Hyphomonas sp.]|nr:cupin domain-containing protein [Hyphomonas sp.]